MPEQAVRGAEPGIHVDIVLDIACVWSYLGYARFRRAVARHREAGGAVEVTFRPFQVAPDASVEGEPLTAVHKREFGADAEHNEARLTALAVGEGLEMNFERAVFANTFEAHRLIALAAEQGRAEATVERLFHAYFVDGRNVADRETLRELATELGVSWNDGFADGVEAELTNVRRSSVASVPQFTVEGGHPLQGAQSEDALRAALDTAAATSGGGH